MELLIDPEFEQLLPPLHDDELAGLRKSIEEDGCMQPLVVWREKNTVVDGHNRYRICVELGVPYKTTEKSFADRNQAMSWMYATQLARRNLSPEMLSYCRGKHYELEKSAAHRPNNGFKMNPLSTRTSERLGNIYSVGPSTIKRDACAAKAIDRVGQVSESAKEKLLSGEVKVTKKDLAELASALPEQVRAAARQIDKGIYTKRGSKKSEKSGDASTAKDHAYYDSIRKHVTDLKNPDLDRSCSFDDYLLMLESHARQFAEGLDVFGPEYYPEVFATITPRGLDQVCRICDSMVGAISAFTTTLGGGTNETPNKKPIHTESGTEG